ncbi:MAG TPA: hypothetical protein EYF93_01090 [Planctomycetes bacterium]|nr:hypothetical protein [Planctomycetota bacterium]
MSDPVIQVTHPHRRPTFQEWRRLVDHVKKHVLDERQRWEDLLPLPLIEQAEEEWLDEGRWGEACGELTHLYHQLIGDQLLASSQHHDHHIHTLRRAKTPDEEDRLTISGLPFSPQTLWISADAKIDKDREVEITVRIESPNSYILRTAYRPDWAMRNSRPDAIRRWIHRRFRFRSCETLLTCPGLERNDQ